MNVENETHIVALKECFNEKTEFSFDEFTGLIKIDKMDGFCLDVERDHFYGHYKMKVGDCSTAVKFGRSYG